jgi:hypothetical protein
MRHLNLTKKSSRLASLIIGCICVFSVVAVNLGNVLAATNTGSGSVGIQGTIPTTPPSRGATISIPGNGQTFSTMPTTVSGTCPSGLLIKVFSNGALIGSTICQNGSFSIQAQLFPGSNVLTAEDYDADDQAGPASNTVTVTYNDAQYVQFGTQMTLSSIYAEKGAPPNTELDWPISINGGTGPYAVSVDWGDGTSSELLSVPNAGSFIIKHTYKSAGIYTVVVKATDKNGEQAYLQLVGQATGAVQHNDTSGGTAKASSTIIIEKTVLWLPDLIILPLLIIAFILGRKHEREVEKQQVANVFGKKKKDKKEDK